MEYKLVVLDIDGTLVNSSGKIGGRTKEALFEARNRGCTLVLASGRPTGGMAWIAKELRLHEDGGCIISFNGGEIFDCKNNKIVSRRVFSKKYVPWLYSLSKEHGTVLLSYPESGTEIDSDDPGYKYVKLESEINRIKVRHTGNFAEGIGYDPVKCIITGDPERLPAIQEVIKEKEPHVFEAYRSESFFLEIMPKGVNKGKALEKLSEITGIHREEIIAFGDSYNDAAMMEYAGIGVAMGNAKPEIKEMAGFVTASHDDDGIADALKYFNII